MIRVELAEEEAQMLEEVAHGYLSDLRMEIRRTDDRLFREHLKKKEAFLQELLKRLEHTRTPVAS